VPHVAFFGGNGHCAARLARARRALSSAPKFELVEIAYPGFEDREAAPSFDAFLASLAGQLGEARVEVGYATGIAALFALSLRARKLANEVRWIFQGPVLWGLEQRWMPRVMRLLPAEPLLRTAFGSTLFQRRFARKQFRSKLDEAERAAFFDGYARCRAFAGFFAWLTPELLRDLERSFATDPAALERIEIWWGDHDRVVDTDELEVTERALHVSFPLRRFATWGHYPMIDDPEGWVREVGDAVA
jgi:pimeloyl-ACP methyl ester carboxylesterase